MDSGNYCVLCVFQVSTDLVWIMCPYTLMRAVPMPEGYKTGLFFGFFFFQLAVPFGAKHALMFVALWVFFKLDLSLSTAVN